MVNMCNTLIKKSPIKQEPIYPLSQYQHQHMSDFYQQQPRPYQTF